MAHYYGWTDEYIESLDIHTFSEYSMSTAVLSRESQMRAISAAISSAQKPQFVKKKLDNLTRGIRTSFDVEISDVNAQYLAEQEAMNGK